MWHRLGRVPADLDRRLARPTMRRSPSAVDDMEGISLRMRYTAFGTRPLSHQLSDYRVDDPYIRGHVHGPCPRSVLDLDHSPTVLRDEDVAGSNPVTPTSGMSGQTHIWILDRRLRAASTAAKYSSDLSAGSL
jgi:hypothetical protein